MMEKQSRGPARHPAPAEVAASLSAATPRFDPLAPRRQPKGAIVAILSLVLHVAVLFFIWDMLFGDPLEKDETIVVAMVEEEIEPEPEPEKARPKVVRQRTLNTATTQRKEVIQNEIRKIEPVTRIAQVQKVEVDRPQRLEAPKVVQQREFTTRTVNEYADIQTPQPVSVPTATESVRTVTEVEQSAGPRLLPAAGPLVQAADYVAPNLNDGVVSSFAQDGDVEGARIQALESGSASRYSRGDGDAPGLQTGQKKNCNQDPVCLQYLKEIERRVYARWRPGTDVAGGEVRLAFRVDKSGAAFQVKLMSADGDVLGETCVSAFRRASPFPPPPKSIHYLTNQGIVATFNYTVGPGE